jgi:hypothetical protein
MEVMVVTPKQLAEAMPSFPPVAAAANSIIVQAMTCSLSSLFLPNRFHTRVDTIVLFFLSEKSKEYLS